VIGSDVGVAALGTNPAAVHVLVSLLTDPSTRVRISDLSALGLLRQTASDASPKITSYTYTDRGQKLQETKANSNTVDYTYFRVFEFRRCPTW
jgi:hypothetical protein